MYWYIISIIALLVVFLIIKTSFFKDKTDYYKKSPMLIEHDDIVYKLGELIKIPTVSYEDKSLIDFTKFDEYIEKVKELYPNVFKNCEFTKTKEYAIKLKLKGKSSLKPTVLMAHYDVVPITEGWDYDPFLGQVVDGYLYGRGTLDTKNTMACILSALEKALENGYIPNNDLYLCFGSNEEVFGDAQVKIVNSFKEEGIKPALVFDEGGGIMSNAFPGVTKDVAFLGVVEKGMANIKLSIDGNGGHSSTPKKNGPSIRLAKALIKLEKHPMKAKYTKTLKEQLRIMGQNASFGLKFLLANSWLFKGLIKKVFCSVSSDGNALFRTTFAFTVLKGGNQSNIIPNHVEAIINVRIAPYNCIDDVIKHIKKVIKDDSIKIEAFDVNKQYPECSFNSDGYNIIKECTIETYNGCVVAPFIMLGGTDGRHYNEISDCVIRFSPMVVTKEDRQGIHGLNEKIKVENLIKCLEFYERLLTKI